MARMTLSAVATSPSTATLAFGNVATDGTIEVQLSPQVGFDCCICPICSVPRGASYALRGLNQRSVLYGRCRDRRADGSTQGWSDIEVLHTPDGALWV